MKKKKNSNTGDRNKEIKGWAGICLTSFYCSKGTGGERYEEDEQ